MKKGLLCLSCTAAIGLFALTTTSAQGAGFALIEQSVSGLGTAFSGAAGAEDASTVYFNPAGMMLLKGQQVVGGIHYIMPKAEFSKTSATNALGAPISGGDGGQGGVNKVVPNLYYAKNFENMAIGLGINAPFGMATEYDKTWVGRYHAVNSNVKTININPSVAFKAGEKLSLGVGVSAQKLEVNLTNMVDFGLASYSNHLTPALTSNKNADIYADMNADSWGYGYNLGALYQYSDSGRVGLAYRSKIKHDVDGDVDFTVQNPTFLAGVSPLLAGAASAYFPDQGISASMSLPASASLNVYHEVNPNWAVMADVTWTQWSSFDTLVINFDQGIGAGGTNKTSVTAEKWDDNLRYSLGTTLKTSDALTLRGGVAYDQTPISEDKYRTPRIPDNSRTWLSAGAGYAITDNVAINFGYAHLFVKESKSEKTATGDDQSRGSLKGTYDTSVDIASTELVVKF